MVAAIVLIVLAVLGLALAAAWYVREPAPLVRLSALISGIIGFLLALLLGAVTGKSALAVAAIALVGAAVLPLMVLGQMRLVRSLIRLQ